MTCPDCGGGSWSAGTTSDGATIMSCHRCAFVVEIFYVERRTDTGLQYVETFAPVDP